MKIKLLFTSIIVFFVFFNAFTKNKHAEISKYMSYKGLVMTGYQGWFNCEGDGADRGWTHYGKKGKFEDGSCTIDYWPEMDEYEVKYKTPFKFADESPAYVFSSYDESTVDLHFRWMKEYGIDGVFMQRFFSVLTSENRIKHNDKVLASAIKAANKYGIAICLMYDIGSMDDSKYKLVMDDWKHLVDDLKLTNQKKNTTYLFHNEKPLVAFWGISAGTRKSGHIPEIFDIMDFFKNDPVYGGCSIHLGIPSRWRTLGSDTKGDPRLHEVLKQADVIQPWLVGRYNEESYEAYRKEHIIDDVKWCKEMGKSYAPTVFPGFSWHNMKGDKSDKIPRNKGAFYWKQITGAIESGAEMLYVAMFDEIDEGTAIMKCSHKVPKGESLFVPYEKEVPSDHYLWLTGMAGKMVRGEIPYSKKIPERNNDTKFVKLERNNFRIVFSEKEEGPLKIALEALIKDFSSVMGFEPVIVNQIDKDNSIPQLVIVNQATKALDLPRIKNKELDGFESHRVYAEPDSKRIYLEGFDLRGTIYAIYTFSEKFLGVPPLHYWSSAVPVKKDEIIIDSNCDIFFKSPQVRYRSILPGDQDFFNPWKKISDQNQNAWLETVLRLKLNTVEAYSTILPDFKLTDYAYLIDKYGLVLTSHHTSGLNTSFRTWADYWEGVRKMDAPKFLLSNEENILDFFRYNAETVYRSGIENLWTIAFRGARDQPFWSIFEDAPENDKERAQVINRMLQIQYDLIKEVTKEEKPYVRITFYDEIATLMAKGFLKPPEGENMIWTYVAARRDPYPYDDLVNFSAEKPVKLGYYMNFGFASTGAHVAPAESPWKMEFNYRYINDKSPLYFSVVNVGNFREFILELSANAEMLWDYDSYNTDQFMKDYCTQYFGAKHADKITLLYKDFFNSYWQPKATEFEGMERQFLFQDLRYARAFDHIYEVFYSSKEEINMNPLHKIGYESVPGRTFRIDLKHNKSKNQVDAMLYGMKKAIPKFELVAARCSRMMIKLDVDKQSFFNDNLRIFSYYMTHLSKTLYHYVFAYKHQDKKDILIKNLDLAKVEAIRAKQYLNETQHGIFETWYSDAEPLTRTFQLDSLVAKITTLKQQALSMK